ncbi:hypothetical protein Poli38472_011139 [Pythium oligandrum]|uniref:Uncharacterized protein n=1 Tax=Pythium oligandrum TaxID=41045 RepID=A0A8K1CQR2_PYTOL|nr:hypothetical protein Poli38472_011139 [Pythium oligandrum]|eukprot:TMW67519.1 hypothetical protein Poli38472_011139 [Pythium oligandrum]
MVEDAPAVYPRGDREIERIVTKFCACLRGELRLEAMDPASIMTAEDETRTHADAWMVLSFKGAGGVDEREDERWRRIRQRLEAWTILSVLACTRTYSWRHNQRFWRQFLHEDAFDQRIAREQRYQRPPSDDVAFARREDEVMPRFVIEFAFEDLNKEILLLLQHVLVGSTKSMRVSFLQAMGALSTMRRQHRKPPVIPVGLRFSRCHSTDSQHIQRLVTLTEAVGSCRVDRDRELGKSITSAYYYRVRSVELRGMTMSEADIRTVSRLSGLPDRLDELILETSISHGTETISSFGMLSTGWFGAQPQCQSVQEPDEEPGTTDQLHEKNELFNSRTQCRLRHVSLNANALAGFHIASLFSAVRDSDQHGVASLSLCGVFQWCGPSIGWMWVVYGILHEESRSRLENLDLSSNLLRLSDIEAVKSALTLRGQALLTTLSAVHAPLAKKTKKKTVWRKKRSNSSFEKPTRVDSTVSETLVELPRGTRLWPTMFKEKGTSELILDETTQTRVCEHQGELLTILLPGYGILRVTPKSIRSAKFVRGPPPSSKAQLPSHLKSLSMNAMVMQDEESSEQVLHAFFSSLELKSLRTLALGRNRLDRHALASVLTCCPLLERLDLESCELDTIAPIIQAFTSNSCRLRSLNLADNLVGGADIVALSQLLCDPESSASQLHELNLERNPIGHQGLRALSNVVKTSCKLRILVLDRTEDRDLVFRPVFYPYENQALGVETLSLDRKLAFLGVLSTRRDHEALEHSVVSHIFHLAAVQCRRRILWR